jgi:hypothetical protein
LPSTDRVVIRVRRAEVLTAGAPFGADNDTLTDGEAALRIGAVVIYGGTDNVRDMLIAALADLNLPKGGP